MNSDHASHPEDCNCVPCQIGRLSRKSEPHQSSSEELLDVDNYELEEALDLLYDAVEQFGHALDIVPTREIKKMSGWRTLAAQVVPGKQFLSLDEFIDLLVNSIMMNSSDLRDFTNKVNRACLVLKDLTVKTVYPLN